MPAPQRVDPARLSQELLDAMRDKGWNQAELADHIGMSQTAISEYIAQKKTPGPQSLTKIVKALGIRSETLALSGKRHVPAATSQHIIVHRDHAELEKTLVQLEVFDAKAAAGTGYLNYESRLLLTLNVPSLVLSQILGFTPPHFLAALYVSGDSMLPTFHDGQLVIYEPTGQMQDHGRYIIEMDGALLVKRVQRYIGGTIRLISDNQSAQYEDEILKPTEGEPDLYVNEKYNTSGKLRVIGRVIWPHDREAIDAQRVAELLRVLTTAGVLHLQ